MRELPGCQPGVLPWSQLQTATQPLLLKGVARQWGLVEAGLRGSDDAMAYLRGHDAGRPVLYSHGPAAINGRPFYNDDFTALNCQVERSSLDRLLERIHAHMQDASPPTFYLASMLVEPNLRGFVEDNPLDFASAGVNAPPSIWIGNRVTASCHYDAPNNIAVCAVGQRRFTLFPPDQISHLYPGPLAPTPGGQVVSVVDFEHPDLQRYPRFAQAWAQAQSVVLEPGDAIYIPSMWWHHVQGLAPFNVLVNYWWNSMPAYVPTPMHALYHALWSIRDRPEPEKQAWREVFEHYVFGPAERAGEHLPEAARHVLGPIDETLARQLRSMLIDKLNR
nr:cupin-like domain-containing protein [Pseudoxanthomonas dokdonensis]